MAVRTFAVSRPGGMNQEALVQVEAFFTDLTRWRVWCSEMVDSARVWIRRARKYPGLHHDSNLYRAVDGSVWEMDFRGPSLEGERVFRRKIRRGGGMSSYTCTDECRVARVMGSDRFEGADGFAIEARAWSEPDADWAWEEYPYGGDFTTERYYTSSLGYAERGLRLANVLLSQREAVVAWMEALVLGQDRSVPDAFNGDVPGLLREFAPNYDKYASDVPDFGSVSCCLHLALDALGGCAGIRTYCF